MASSTSRFAAVIAKDGIEDNNEQVFRCRKNFVHEIFAVTDNHENFLTAKISRYMV